MGLAPLLGAGISLLGGLFQNKSNQNVSAKQMAFQERMSNTQYQRGMTDMRKAGLNPMLAYKQGGASSPSGAGIPMKNPAEGVPAAISSAVQLRRVKAEIANLESTAGLNQERLSTERAVQAANYSNSALAIERANTEIANQGLTSARTNTEYQNENIAATVFQNHLKQGQLLFQEITIRQAQAVAATIEQKIDESGYGQTLRWLNRLGVANPTQLIRQVPKMIKGAR